MVCWNIAHRGGAGLHPENTLAAFADAVARGCDGAELDVQLSRDGEVVVFHDFRLNPAICRGADGAWLKKPTSLIKDLSLEELRRLDVGRVDPDSDYARQHPHLTANDGECIPTLADVIAVVKKASKPFNLFVELKSSFFSREISASPEALAEATIKVLRAENFVGQTVLVGFDWPGLLRARTIEPSIECWFSTLEQSWFRTGPVPDVDEPPPASVLEALRHWAATGTSPWANGYDAVNYGGSLIRAIAAAGGNGWFAYHRDVTKATVIEAQKLGLKIGAWTVDDPAEMQRLMGFELDAICTDRPDVLAAELRGG